MFRLGEWKSRLDSARIAEAQVEAGQSDPPHRALVPPRWRVLAELRQALQCMGPNAVKAERHPAMGSRDLRQIAAMGDTPRDLPRPSHSGGCQPCLVGATLGGDTPYDVCTRSPGRGHRQLGRRRRDPFVQATIHAKCEAQWQMVA